MIDAAEFLQHNPAVLGNAVPRNGTAEAEASAVPSAPDGPRSSLFGGASERRHRGASARGVSADAQVLNTPNEDEDACREAALRLLDAAPRSSGALRDRLVGKGYAEDVADRVIARLIEVRLLDDREYAESVVRICANRMMGRRGAAMELARKGVDRMLAAQVTEDAEQNGVFEEAAWELGRSVARKTQGLDRQVRQRRFWAAGGRKGHNPAILREVAAELLG